MVPKTSQITLAYITGIAAAFAGILVLIGWQLDSNTIKTLGLMGVTMKANTAICFIFTGLAIIFLQQKNQKIQLYLARIFSFAALLLGALVLSQYLFNINLGIDELIYQDADNNTFKTVDPGRMAPNTSLNFIFAGLSILLISFNKSKNSLFALFLITLAICISVFGIIGYVFGLAEMTGFAGYTKMALSTSILFVISFVGLLLTMYHDSEIYIAIERKLFAGFTISATIIIFISFLFISNLRSMDQAADLVKHTYIVKNNLEEILISVIDLETGSRGFALSGNDLFLEPMTNAKRKINGQIARFKQLTKGNPNAQYDINELESIIIEKIKFTDLTVQTRKLKGLNAASLLIKTNRGQQLTNSLRNIKNKMIAEENRLLALREEAEDEQLAQTQTIVIFGVLFQTLLFALLFFFFSKDLSGKRKAQKELQDLAEDLEKTVEYRTSDLKSSNEKIIIERDKANQYLDIAGVMLVLLDSAGKVSKINKKGCEVLGYQENEIVGKDWFETMVPKNLKHEVSTAFEGMMKGNIEAVEFYENPIINKNGEERLIEWHNVLLRDLKGKPTGTLSSGEDITERKAATNELLKANRVYAVLRNINQTIVRVEDKQSLYDEACRIAVDYGKFKMAWVGMVDKLSNKVIAFSSAGFEEGYLKTVNIDLSVENAINSPIGRTIKLGVHTLVNDIASDPEMVPWRENALRQGYKSSAAFPIKVFGETIGAFMLYSCELFFFDETEVKLLDELAMDISFAIEFLDNETIRKLTEEKLNRNEAILMQTSKIAKVGGWDLDLQTMQLNWSAETYRIHEIDPSVKPNVENAINFYAPEARPVITKALQRATEEGLAFDIDAQFITAKGNNLWVRSIGEAAFSNDKCVRLFGTFQDITERKQAEEEILNLNRELENKIELRTAQLAETNKNLLDEIEERRQIEDKFKLVVESSPNAIILVSSNGIIQLINKQTENYFGYNRDELIGNKIEILVPDAIGIGHVNLHSDFTSNPTTRHMGAGHDLFGLRKDGTKIPVEVGLNPILINNEMMILTSIVDITERKKAEEDIKNAKTEAERANLAKSEFLSRMSHELRTPLNSILGFTQLMRMGELNPTHKKGVDHIMKSGNHLLNLINEVLDLSRIEAGELSLSIEPVELKALILETLDVVYPLAKENNIKLELTETEALQLFVKADNQKLKQVLLNIINNAIKFNNKDGLVSIAAKNVKNEKVRISITDTGKGISEEELPKLFMPFQRIGSEISTVEGTGLGLAVSKKLTEAMNGTIGIESKVGKGSTFWVELPLSIGHMESHLMEVIFDELPSNITNKSGTILYIEDNFSNQELVKQIIDTQRPAIKLITSLYGKDTLKLALDYKPSLIFLDLNLPDMHGSKVLELLQKEPKTKNIPVVVLSADAMDKQINTLLKLGAKAYLTKPLNVLEFLKVTDDVINS